MVNTAVILSGGKSTRYGRPKGLETICGKPIIGRLADEIRAAGIDNIFLSADESGQYSSLELPAIPDRYKNCGPLAGIHSALIETGVEAILVLPCDLPGLTSKEIKFLLDESEKNPAPVIFARTPGQEHPLCSVVRRDLLEKIEGTLSEKKNATLRFFKSVDHGTVFFSDDRPFKNVNTPEDLTAWEAENVS